MISWTGWVKSVDAAVNNREYNKITSCNHNPLELTPLNLLRLPQHSSITSYTIIRTHFFSAKKGDTSITESPKVKTPSIFEKAAKGSPKAKKNKVSQDEVENVLSNEELEAIKADSVNAKLWEGCVDICKTSGKTVTLQCILCLVLRI